MKYFIIFLTIGCLCNSLVDTKNVSSEIRSSFPIKGFIYNILITLLKKCDLNLRKIIINDDFYYIESSLAIAEIQPPISVTIMRNAGVWRPKSQYRFDDIEIDAVILIIDMTYDPWPDFNKFFLRWRFKRNSLIYIIPRQLEFCSSYQQTLLYIMRFYFSAAYYICVKHGRYPLIYTHDPYGDTKPPHWYKIKQQFIYGKNWTFYGRGFDQDLDEMCIGFNFKRTDPNNQISVIVGIPFAMMGRQFTGNVNKIYDESYEEQMNPSIRDRIVIFKRLLKLRFQYIVLDNRNLFETLIRTYDLTSVDTMLFVEMVISQHVWWHYFYPILYEPYAILSHNRGFMTPLEKIAKFYGIWTLLSLTAMLSMAFILTWLATKNISLAVFDLFRLLINSTVMVPLNTRSQKIFFSMVFLYFLIIHATFSGHLAEFLTSVNRRSNVESLKDLKDPKIEKIIQFGYEYDKDFIFLRKKSSSRDISYACEEVIKNPNFACIAPLPILEETRLKVHNNNNTLYISKEKIGLSMIGSLYRPGFPLREKINWAIMFMFDTNIIHEKVKKNRERLAREDKTRGALIAIGYRVITIKDIYFAFMFLIIGNCVGIICFLIEISIKNICHKVKNRHHKKGGNILSIIRHYAGFVCTSSEKKLKSIHNKVKNRFH